VRNEELVAIFEEVADLIEIQGGQPFRVNSYRRAARAIKNLTEPLDDIMARGELSKIDGIGKSTAAKIEEFSKSGKVALHRELLSEMPEGLPALLKIPGMGPKKVSMAWKELKVTNLAELQEAIRSGALAKLKGMGEKSVKQIAEGIAFVEKAGERTALGLALPLAEELAESLRAVRSVRRVEIGGSVRRGCETIGDLDLLCESDDGERVVKAFTQLPQVRRVLAAGDTKGSVIVERRDGGEMQADCRVVPAESFGAALQYFTGSKEHNVRLRERAAKKNWKLNEWGLFDGDRRLAGEDEAGIYKKLGLSLMPPETREDRGEFDADAIDQLIRLEDIRGDFHMHTTASDGKSEPRELADAARDLGYEYIAITDHSRSSAVANGLSLDRMWRQIERIRELNRKYDSVAILIGCECDILSDGKLDYPDSILSACDVVVASVHSALRQERRKITDRVLAAMDNPYVTIVGHPTGRLINRRAAMDLDMKRLIEHAAATHTALELNAAWQRLDLSAHHARMARDAGVMLSIDTDAHSVAQLAQMRYGIMTARRGWLRAADVLNTRPLAAVRMWIKKKRKA
jgi:DNA polymerase (family 10)